MKRYSDTFTFPPDSELAPITWANLSGPTSDGQNEPPDTVIFAFNGDVTRKVTAHVDTMHGTDRGIARIQVPENLPTQEYDAIQRFMLVVFDAPGGNAKIEKPS